MTRDDVINYLARSVLESTDKPDEIEANVDYDLNALTDEVHLRAEALRGEFFDDPFEAEYVATDGKGVKVRSSCLFDPKSKRVYDIKSDDDFDLLVVHECVVVGDRQLEEKDGVTFDKE